MPKPTTAEHAKFLIDAYRAELRRDGGDGLDPEREIEYRDGYFYLTIHHGSGLRPFTYVCSWAYLEQMIQELQQRPEVSTERQREGTLDA